MLLDVNESPDHLDDLIKSHNVVISLLPWTMHPVVLKRYITINLNILYSVHILNRCTKKKVLKKLFYRCIANKKDMVTASYCTEAMQALHQEAQIAGISVVNEVGLDPGKFSKKYQGIF